MKKDVQFAVLFLHERRFKGEVLTREPRDLEGGRVDKDGGGCDADEEHRGKYQAAEELAKHLARLGRVGRKSCRTPSVIVCTWLMRFYMLHLHALCSMIHVKALWHDVNTPGVSVLKCYSTTH